MNKQLLCPIFRSHDRTKLMGHLYVVNQSMPHLVAEFISPTNHDDFYRIFPTAGNRPLDMTPKGYFTKIEILEFSWHATL
jgi:hypothetical protein